MAKRIVIALTPGQAAAMSSLLGYGEAGEPDDVGMTRRMHAQLAGVRAALEAPINELLVTPGEVMVLVDARALAEVEWEDNYHTDKKRAVRVLRDVGWKLRKQSELR